MFRRIAARLLFDPPLPSDITLVNWPQIDYVGGPVFGVPDAEHHAHAARQLSLSFLQWLQTEGGLPGLRLRGDVVGDTPDGLAKALYIRESRRIVGERRVVEQDVAHAVRGDTAPSSTTTASGSARTGSTCTPPRAATATSTSPAARSRSRSGRSSRSRLENLLAGAKNVATTHITNGAYRLHPVEWNIGEAAGHLAAYCGARRTTPRAVREQRQRTSSASWRPLESSSAGRRASPPTRASRPPG